MSINASRCAVVMVLVAGAAAWGGVPARAQHGASEVSSKIDPQTLPQRRGTAAPNGTLRCWQHGRLILDLNGVATLETGSNPAVAPRAKSGVSVFDFRNGLCVLEREDPHKPHEVPK